MKLTKGRHKMTWVLTATSMLSLKLWSKCVNLKRNFHFDLNNSTPYKMLVKLTPVVNFINIVLALVYFVQKGFKQLFSSYILALQFFTTKILAKKICIKCWWNWHLLGSHCGCGGQFFCKIEPVTWGASEKSTSGRLLRGSVTRSTEKIMKGLFPELSGVNFINVLHSAFTLVDPESIKNTVNSSVTFYAFSICGH